MGVQISILEQTTFSEEFGLKLCGYQTVIFQWCDVLVLCPLVSKLKRPAHWSKKT